MSTLSPLFWGLLGQRREWTYDGRGIHDVQDLDYVGVVGCFDVEAYQLEVAGVHHQTLVDGGESTVTYRVGSCGVGVGVLDNTEVVRVRGEWTVGRDCPCLQIRFFLYSEAFAPKTGDARPLSPQALLLRVLLLLPPQAHPGGGAAVHVEDLPGHEIGGV